MESRAPGARIFIDKQSPEPYRALTTVAAAVRAAGTAAGLDRKLIELINLRVSQINGCAFCLDVHHRAAIAAGATEQQVTVLPAWRRSELYTPQEQAALALAEITTVLPDEATIADAYALAHEQLSDDQMSVVIWVATTIGAFNRVSIMSKHPVRAEKETRTMTESTAEGSTSDSTDGITQTKVVRNDNQHRYEVFYGTELAGFTEYEERAGDTVFVHTEIDGAFSGKGLGKVLAKNAIEDVISRGSAIVPRCPFIKAFLDKHSEYDAHVIGKGITR